MEDAEVAVNGTFNLVPRYAGMSEELKEELEDELEGLEDAGGIDCRMIKMPSGNSKAFEVESEDLDDPDLEKELRGVIIFTHRMNARWEGEYGGENRMPACSSWDGKQGTFFETGEIVDCGGCPYNAFKDDGSGKECKNTRRVYLMLDGRPQLYLLTVPPTSLKAVSKQLKRIITNGSPLTRSVVAFKLEAAKSKGGVDYAKVSVTRVGDLTKEQGDMARQMREEIKRQYTTVGVDAEECDAAGAAAGDGAPLPPSPDGFMNIPDGPGDDGTPFE